MVRIARAKATRSYGRLTPVRPRRRRRYVGRRAASRAAGPGQAPAPSPAAARSALPSAGDWLAGLAMVGAALSWGVVAALVAG